MTNLSGNIGEGHKNESLATILIHPLLIFQNTLRLEIFFLFALSVDMRVVWGHLDANFKCQMCYLTAIARDCLPMD